MVLTAQPTTQADLDPIQGLAAHEEVERHTHACGAQSRVQQPLLLLLFKSINAPDGCLHPSSILALELGLEEGRGCALGVGAWRCGKDALGGCVGLVRCTR